MVIIDAAEFLAQAKKRASSQKKKSLPKRSSRPAHKERRKRSWLRGQAKKEVRRKAQAIRENRNRQLRSRGELTPWEKAKAARAKARGA